MTRRKRRLHAKWCVVNPHGSIVVCPRGSKRDVKSVAKRMRKESGSSGYRIVSYAAHMK